MSKTVYNSNQEWTTNSDYNLINVRKEAIKNGQFRDTDDIGNKTQRDDKQYKNTIQKAKKMSNTDPIKYMET